MLLAADDKSLTEINGRTTKYKGCCCISWVVENELSSKISLGDQAQLEMEWRVWNTRAAQPHCEESGGWGASVLKVPSTPILRCFRSIPPEEEEGMIQEPLEGLHLSSDLGKQHVSL